VNAYEGKADMV